MAACAKKSPTAPVNANVAGNWSGPVSDALLGSGTVSFSLVQAANDSLSGTWATVFANPVHNLSGNVVGAISGSKVSIILKPASPPTCQYGPFLFTGALAGTTLMSGTFASAIDCVVADSGTFSASKH